METYLHRVRRYPRHPGRLTRFKILDAPEIYDGLIMRRQLTYAIAHGEEAMSRVEPVDYVETALGGYVSEESRYHLGTAALLSKSHQA